MYQCCYNSIECLHQVTVEEKDDVDPQVGERPLVSSDRPAGDVGCQEVAEHVGEYTTVENCVHRVLNKGGVFFDQS